MRRASSLMVLLLACGGDGPVPAEDPVGEPPRGFEPPVVTNPEPPIAYPPALYDDGVEGTVVLRLFVDEQGRLVPESTQVAEGSGHPALDSAAEAGVAAMRFAPARRDGTPVPTTFLQPVHFRIPGGGSGGGDR